MSRTGRAKRDREKARQEKAAVKRDRRQSRLDSPEGGEATDEEVVARPQVDVLADLAALHAQFEDGGMELDDFEESKARLIGQLDVG